MMYQRALTLMEASVGNDLVALDPAGGNCFGFNEVAAAVWRELETPRSLDQLEQAMLDQFDVDAETCHMQLVELLASMSDQGLIRPA